MRNRKHGIGIFVCCAILLGSSLAMAQDWPQWRGPNRDDKVTGFTAPATWPTQFTQKWKVRRSRWEQTAR